MIAWILLILFLLLTLFFLTGWGAPFLIGFNHLPKEQQVHYRSKALSYDFGAFVLLPLDVMWLICLFLKQDYLIALVVLLYVIYLVVCAAVFKRRGGLQHYRKRPRKKPENP